MSREQLACLRTRAAQFIRKNRLLAAAALAGLLLALLPGKTASDSAQTKQQTQQHFDLAGTRQELETILSSIDGAGRVQLMLTLSTGERVVYQTDERTSSDTDTQTTQTQTVFRQISGSEKEPAAQTVVYPQYQGALVVCDGADCAGVRLAVIQAVSSLTGLGSNKIAVVKMKGQ